MKKLSVILCLCAVLLCVFPVFSSADTGPKPSVTLSFAGDYDGEFYVTLLSSTDSYGPYSVYTGSVDDAFRLRHAECEEDVFMKFVAYKDADGYYFLQMLETSAVGSGYGWSYYPPDPFKVLIYFPERDTFSVSEITERYVFESVYKVTIGEDLSLTVAKDFHVTEFLGGFCLRLAVCFAVELLIALLFRYKVKQQIKIIVLTNLITQLLLNTVLNAAVILRGALSGVVWFIFAEIVVFFAEALIYTKTLEKYSPGPRKKAVPVLYALTANAVSLLAGLLLR